MDFCDTFTLESIVKELCQPNIIVDLITHMYGNYGKILNKLLVLQKAMSLANEPYYSVFINTIGPILESLKNLKFGVKLYSKLYSKFPELKAFVKENNKSNINNTGLKTNKIKKPKKNPKNFNNK